MLPDFLCIGAQKAGTTWLHRQLSGHPEIYLPPAKELDYFFRDRTLDWYEAQFADAEPGQRIGELSPNYMPWQPVPDAMAALLPNARLIVLLRDPADRAWSQWKMARGLGNIDHALSFREAFERDERFLRTRGCYASLIERFARHYPVGEQLRMFLYDDITARPLALLREIFEFLGVDPGYEPTAYREVVHGAANPERIDSADRAALVAHYRGEVEAVEALLGRSLEHWRR